MSYEILHTVVHLTSALEFLKLDTVGAKPLTIRMSGSQALLDFSVVVYLSLLGVDKQNLTRLQASLLGNLRGVEVHHSHLTCHNHHVVLGDGVACGTKTVAVEHTACIASVAEEQGSRSVPRFHKDRVVFIEGLEVLGYRVFVVEALWYHHTHGVGQ